jgi:TPR repeat protein
MYLHGEQGVTSDLNRYAGWLQYATMLGNRDASYELAVHYRRQDQPVLASLYETRAIEMGYNPPRWLDHVRK